MNPTIQITVVVDNSSKLKAALKEFNRYDLLVGYPGEANQPRSDTELTNAQIAYINDRGSPAQNIPPRPFLKPGVLSVEKELTASLKKTAVAAIEGRPSEVEQGLGRAGLIGQAGVQRYITTAEFTPLAPMTLRMRQARGFMGEKPLMVTGQLRAAVTYVVRPRS